MDRYISSSKGSTSLMAGNMAAPCDVLKDLMNARLKESHNSIAIPNTTSNAKTNKNDKFMREAKSTIDDKSKSKTDAATSKIVNRGVKRKHDENVACPSAFGNINKSIDTAKRDSWDAFETTTNVSTSGKFIATSQSSKGWRQVDGQKVYKTFRDGRPIQVQGKDAFVAYLGDSKRRKTSPSS